MAITILQRDNKPEEWRRITGWIAEARAAGVPMLGQVLTRATGILLGLEISQNPFHGRPSYMALLDLPFEQRVAAMFRGDPINSTERRAVLHTALRSPFAGSAEVQAEVRESRAKLADFSGAVRRGDKRGITGKKFRHVVNI